MNAKDVAKIIAGGESLTVEFKGESRHPFSDRDLYEAVVAMANSAGGVLLIGIEDDGRVTGARSRHGQATDTARLQAAVFNNTMPGISVTAERVSLPGGEVLLVSVPRLEAIAATASGNCQRRIVGANGPENIPYLPHEHAMRRTAIGAEDFTAQVCEPAEWESLDPLQFERARQLVGALRGDSALLELSNREMAQALRLVESQGNGKLKPNYAGVLLLGKREFLERHVPTHQGAFQVLTVGADVRVNEFFRNPLLEMAELFQSRFDARTEEREVQAGLIRLPIPDYARPAFREVLLNALFHRDYRRLGTAYVQWYPERLEISSPGGFPEGLSAWTRCWH